MQVSRKLAGILTWALVIMVIAVMYLLLFNPQLPNGVLQILSPVIYLVEFLILIFGLLYMNGFGLGESDLGVWGFGILGVVLIFFALIFFFGAGFVPRAYLSYDAWFGVILGILGFFALFRTRRRYGQFIYIR